MRSVLAIDPSLTSTGVCRGRGSDDWEISVCKSRPLGSAVTDRVRRYEGLVGQINGIAEQAEPALIFIEGYSFGSRSSGMTQAMITEFGSLLRWHLIDQTPHVYEVAPSTLKKFATGKGNSKKEQVIAYVQKHWNQLFETSDEADAFVLYQMALVASGRVEATNQAQRDAVAKVLEQNPITPHNLKTVCNSTEVPF